MLNLLLVLKVGRAGGIQEVEGGQPAGGTSHKLEAPVRSPDENIEGGYKTLMTVDYFQASLVSRRARDLRDFDLPHPGHAALAAEREAQLRRVRREVAHVKEHCTVHSSL